MINLQTNNFYESVAEDTYPVWDEDSDRIQIPPVVWLIGVVIIIIFVFSSLLEQIGLETAPMTSQGQAVISLSNQQNVETTVANAHSNPPQLFNPSPSQPFIAPYKSYILTQGAHGFSYGHMAIDITAGDGTEIVAPINGRVTQLYIDEYANTVLVIENEQYQVTLMHGNYTVGIGDALQQGQPIGTESNNGYTMDASGNLCYQRECGYHTHLNVFDKLLGININPLDLLEL